MMRFIRQHRAYVAVAVATLATAIGVNLAVFTVVNALWLRPLPIRDPDRVVTLMNFVGAGLRSPLLSTFQSSAGQITDAGSNGSLRPQLAFDNVGRDLEILGVTSNYFDVLGVGVQGRSFTPADDHQGAEPVAIVSQRLWQQKLGSRGFTVGSVMPAKPFSIRIVGIAAGRFVGARRGEQVDVWVPRSVFARLAGNSGGPDDLPLLLFGRLRPGDSPAQIERRWSSAFQDSRLHVDVVPLPDVFGTVSTFTVAIKQEEAVTVVSGLAALVLFGGCVTLMAMVLVHYERRRRDFAVCPALGASRSRLIRQLSSELVVVGLAGTVAALFLSYWLLRLMPALSLPGGVDLSRLDLSMDWRVLLVGAGLTVVTLLAAAIVPIHRFTNARIVGDLVGASSTITSSQRTRQVLLALHVGATAVVLVSAGLFVRAVVVGFGAGMGFGADQALFVTVGLSSSGFAAPLKPGQNYREATFERTARVREALAAMPTVQAAAVGISPIGKDAAGVLDFGGARIRAGRRQGLLKVGILSGSRELLDALSLPLLLGRPLTDADAEDAGIDPRSTPGSGIPARGPAPVVLTASLAAALWPDENPLGRVFSTGSRWGQGEVVGVTKDFAFGSLAQPSDGVVIMMTRFNLFQTEPTFVVKGADPIAVAADVRRAIGAAVPDVGEVTTMTGEEVIAKDIGQQRLGAWFLSGFGITAFLVGVGGVFALVAYLAESRRREFGVRLALGATERDLAWHGLKIGLVPVITGMVAGLLIAVWTSRLYSSMLIGLSGTDPLTYGLTMTLMLGAAAVAGLLATGRLRRLQPMDALRVD